MTQLHVNNVNLFLKSITDRVSILILFKSVQVHAVDSFMWLFFFKLLLGNFQIYFVYTLCIFYYNLRKFTKVATA